MAETVERLAVLIEANTKSYERAMARLEQRTRQSMDRSAAAVTTLDTRIKGLALGLMRAGATLGIGFGALGLGSIARDIRQIVAEADDLKNVAAKVSLTTDALQELRYAAKLTGIEANQLDTAMQRFARRTAEAAAGSGELAKVLELNGVAIRNADGSIRDSRELLGDYADLIKNAASEQDKLRLAFLAFDTEGAALVNTLRNGKKGLEDWRKEAHEVGAVLDDDLIEKAAEVNREWTTLTTQMETRWKTLVLNLVGGVADIKNAYDELGEATNDFVRDLLMQWSKINPLVGAGIGAGVLVGGTTKKGGSSTKANYPTGETPTTVDDLLRQIGLKSTNIPSNGNSGNGSTRDRIGEATKALEDQLKMLGMTERAAFIYNEVIRSGAAANSEAEAKIKALAGRLYDQREALAANVAAMDRLRDFAKEFLSGFISDLRRGESAVDALGNALNRLADRIIDAQLDRFISALLGAAGTAGGGASQQAASIAFGGARARGGDVVAGRAYLVGERGPEMFVPRTSGAIAANANGGATVQIIDQRSSGEAVSIDRQQGANGEQLVRVLIRDEMTGKTGRDYARAHGLQRQVTRR